MDRYLCPYLRVVFGLDSFVRLGYFNNQIMSEAKKETNRNMNQLRRLRHYLEADEQRNIRPSTHNRLGRRPPSRHENPEGRRTRPVHTARKTQGGAEADAPVQPTQPGKPKEAQRRSPHPRRPRGLEPKEAQKQNNNNKHCLQIFCMYLCKTIKSYILFLFVWLYFSLHGRHANSIKEMTNRGHALLHALKSYFYNCVTNSF
uniref:Uncharacterized protein n=1 Tax=Glossina pallidipes TaxID=7398 RepID=A0A1B0ACQ6_GLOPL